LKEQILYPKDCADSLTVLINEAIDEEVSDNNSIKISKNKSIKLNNIIPNKLNKNENPNKILNVDLKNEIMQKLSQKFVLDEVLVELNNTIEMKNASFLVKMEFIANRMNDQSRIDINMFLKILSALNIEISKYEATWVFKQLDDDQSGKITKIEMINLIKMFQNIEYPIYAQLFLKIFNMIDIDHSGTVDVEELSDFMKDLGFEINENQVQVLINRFGNKINFYTFVSLFDFIDEVKKKYE